MKLCRFEENHIGVIRGDHVHDVSSVCEILERLSANGIKIVAGPLITIPPAIHSFYFFDPNGIRLEIVSDLSGDDEDLQVSRSCGVDEAELRRELASVSNDQVWIEDMILAMSR